MFSSCSKLHLLHECLILGSSDLLEKLLRNFWQLFEVSNLAKYPCGIVTGMAGLAAVAQQVAPCPGVYRL